MNHTPGPWFTDEEPTAHKTQFEHGRQVIVMCPPAHGSCFHTAIVDGPSNLDQIEEMRANARLIAAAPELYEALNSLLKCINVRIDDPRCDRFDAARAALRKARGRQIPGIDIPKAGE